MYDLSFDFHFCKIVTLINLIFINIFENYNKLKFTILIQYDKLIRVVHELNEKMTFSVQID